IVSNCIMTANVASNNFGGGAYGGTLDNCTLTGNSSANGAGACNGTLNNCTLSTNSAASGGGGAYGGTLNNCMLTKNSAQSGGGAYASTLNNCLLTANTGFFGGGVCGSTLSNCIIYYNLGPGGNCDSTSLLNYCCTTPIPANGANNLSTEPQLASVGRLSANSPCLGKGSYASATGVDMDGEPWANPPAIGCDEYYSGSVTGAL